MRRFMRFSFGFLLVSILIAGIISLFASGSPDGFERVLEDHSGDEEIQMVEQEAPMPDYTVPGVGNEHVSTALAGVFGTVATLLVGYGIGRLLQTRPKSEPDAK